MDISDSMSQSKQGRPVLKRFAQQAQINALYKKQLPWWRRPIFGYLGAFPLTALAWSIVMLSKYVGGKFYFPSAFLVLVVLFSAMIWGIGPALVSVLLCTAVLDYFYLPPIGSLSLIGKAEWAEILPFIVSGLIITIITGQREFARQNALLAEQEAKMRSVELSSVNARLETVNKELAHANELKDQFLSMASHELKTPITTIRGQAQIMLRRLSRVPDLPDDLAVVRDSLARIDQQTYRLNSLVDDLLDLTRIRSGKLAFHKSQIDLSQICREVIDEQKTLLDREVEFKAPLLPVKVCADADRLNQVMVNLVNNALKYSAENTPVKVAVEQEDHKALVRVHNFGPVIPADQRSLIFEMFYRTPDAALSTKKGSGLGLAISKEIILGHDGQIWCDSSASEGTTFTISLPR